MTIVFRRFGWMPEVRQAVEIWRQADRPLARITELADALHAEVADGHPDRARVRAILRELDATDREAAALEDAFSASIGVAARRAQDLLLLASVVAVTTLLTLAGTVSWRLQRRAAGFERRARALVDNARDMVFTYDGDGRITFVNRAWCDTMGYSADQAREMRALDLVEPEDVSVVQESEAAQLRGGPTIPAPVRWRARDGRTVWVETTLAPRIARGRVIEVEAIARDVTERVIADEARRAATERERRSEKLRALGQMASGVAHDLNQSLALIAGYSGLAQQAVRESEPRLPEVERQLEIVVRAAMDGGETVMRLLRFGGRAATEGEREQPVELGPLLQDVATLTAPRWRDQLQADGRSIELSVVREGGLWIGGIAPELREALTNLVFNAVDALPNGGRIRLRALRDGADVVLEVTDDGVGMPAEVQQRVFEPFFTTKGERGTGLGLALVFATVEQHRGTVALDSAPGRGTTFRLSFPAIAPPGSTAPPDSALTPTGEHGVDAVLARSYRADDVRTILTPA
jgi:PAS domain S-box-containing protein